jgi:hypothetical protein
LRALDNAVPGGLLFLVVVGAFVAISALGLVCARRWLPSWQSHASNLPLTAVTATVMTLFALVLAFTVVNLYQTFDSASRAVLAEADALSVIGLDALAFPSVEQARIDEALADYIREVRDREFPDLRSGRQDPAITEKLTGISAALQGYSPRSQTQIAYYDEAVARANEVVVQHRERIHVANTPVPAPIVTLLLVTAVLIIASTMQFKVDRPGLEMAMVCCVAAAVASGLVTALLLQYPFSGWVSISSAPYAHGFLAHILGAHG